VVNKTETGEAGKRGSKLFLSVERERESGEELPDKVVLVLPSMFFMKKVDWSYSSEKP